MSIELRPSQPEPGDWRQRLFQRRLPIIGAFLVLGYLAILTTAFRYQLLGEPEIERYRDHVQFYEEIVIAMIQDGLREVYVWVGIFAALAGLTILLWRLSTNRPQITHKFGHVLSSKWEGSVLLALTLLLTAWGAVYIYSSSYTLAISWGLEEGYFLRAHLKAVLLGAVAFLIVQCIDYRVLVRSVPLVTMVLMLLLLLVLLPSIGIHHNGASRWVRLGPLTLQPSEFARFALIAFLALHVSRQATSLRFDTRRFRGLAAILGTAALLILLEPNYGMLVELVAVFLTFLLVMGIRPRTFAAVLVFSAIALTFLLVTSDYRIARIVAFLDPYGHSLLSGYQAIQSLVGIANGGLWGTGIGAGRQKLLHLPEMHTDFIAAVIGEEAGFVGLSFLATIYLGIFFLCMRIASRSSDVFGRLFAFGVGVSVVLSAYLHMGICLALIPTTGMVLPFISYGKSSVVAHMMAIGLVYKIATRAERQEQ